MRADTDDVTPSGRGRHGAEHRCRPSPCRRHRRRAPPRARAHRSTTPARSRAAVARRASPLALRGAPIEPRRRRRPRPRRLGRTRSARCASRATSCRSTRPRIVGRRPERAARAPASPAPRRASPSARAARSRRRTSSSRSWATGRRDRPALDQRHRSCTVPGGAARVLIARASPPSSLPAPLIDLGDGNRRSRCLDARAA